MTAGSSQRDRVIAASGAKPGSAEDYPFGDEAAVFKVAGRMFALVPLGQSHHAGRADIRGPTPGSGAHVKPGNAASAARPWPSVKQPTVHTDRPRDPTPVRHASVDTAT